MIWRETVRGGFVTSLCVTTKGRFKLKRNVKWIKCKQIFIKKENHSTHIVSVDTASRMMDNHVTIQNLAEGHESDEVDCKHVDNQ